MHISAQVNYARYTNEQNDAIDERSACSKCSTSLCQINGFIYQRQPLVCAVPWTWNTVAPQSGVPVRQYGGVAVESAAPGLADGPNYQLISHIHSVTPCVVSSQKIQTFRSFNNPSIDFWLKSRVCDWKLLSFPLFHWTTSYFAISPSVSFPGEQEIPYLFSLSLKFYQPLIF